MQRPSRGEARTRQSCTMRKHNCNNTNTHTHAHTHMHLCICTCICDYKYIYILYVYMYLHISISLYPCIDTYIYICVYMYIYISLNTSSYRNPRSMHHAIMPPAASQPSCRRQPYAGPLPGRQLTATPPSQASPACRLPPSCRSAPCVICHRVAMPSASRHITSHPPCLHVTIPASHHV